MSRGAGAMGIERGARRLAGVVGSDEVHQDHVAAASDGADVVIHAAPCWSGGAT
jgi:hypothetical protein